MPGLDVLILNGASGTGKTSTAAALTKLVDGAFWVHPDELWDTPEMDPGSILDLALEHAFHTQNAGLAVLDCQIQPSLIPASIEKCDVHSWVSVLHICPRKLREARLLARGWASDDFDRIDTWAGILHEESVATDSLVIDTSAHDTQAVCGLILEHIRRRGLQNDA